MEEAKRSQVIAAGWNYTQKRDILALYQTPLAPSKSRTYMGGKRLGRTKVGKRRQKQIERERQQRLECPVPLRRVDSPVPLILTNSVAPQTTHPEWPSDWLKEPLRWPKGRRRTNAEVSDLQGSELCWPKNIRTVSKLWQHWENIIKSGPPLEQRFPKGVKWVDQPTEQQFDRRRPVLNAILGSPDHSKAATQLETLRVDEGWSLLQLADLLQKEREERLAGPNNL